MNTSTITPSSGKSPNQNILFYHFRRYIGLTKPRIVLLLTITGLIGFLIASRLNLDLIILISAIYMGYASAGGAMAINSYVDRDIDQIMGRTKNRASVSLNPIKPPEKILIFGGLLVASSLLVAIFVFNLLTALFVFWGVFFYLFGYSLYLKRKSILQNIIGGLASPTPVWVGYAAILNLDMLTSLEAWLLGFLVFVWTPSHTWALSSKYWEEYKNAGIPVFPAVYGLKRTSQVTFIWIFVLLGYTTLLAQWMTSNLVIHLILLVPNLFLLRSGYKFFSSPTTETAYKCFKTHNIWLAITFITIWLLMPDFPILF